MEAPDSHAVVVVLYGVIPHTLPSQLAGISGKFSSGLGRQPHIPAHGRSSDCHAEFKGRPSGEGPCQRSLPARPLRTAGGMPDQPGAAGVQLAHRLQEQHQVARSQRTGAPMATKQALDHQNVLETRLMP